MQHKQPLHPCNVLSFILNLFNFYVFETSGDVVILSCPEVGETIPPNFKPDSWELESAILSVATTGIRYCSIPCVKTWWTKRHVWALRKLYTKQS